MKHYMETAGSSLDQALKCDVYCTSVETLARVNEIYARDFRDNPPARFFLVMPAWPSRFDIDIDCIAAIKAPTKAEVCPCSR